MKTIFVAFAFTIVASFGAYYTYVWDGFLFCRGSIEFFCSSRRLLSGRLYGSGDRRCRSRCPLPVLKLKKRIEPLQPGSLVRLDYKRSNNLKRRPSVLWVGRT